MLKEDAVAKHYYNTLLRHIYMFASFFILSVFVYTFHVVQAAVLYRTYATSVALITCGFGISLSKSKATRHLWMSACAWFVYSVVYFDLRTHLQTFYWLAVILFVAFPVCTVQGYYGRKYGIVLRVLFWLFVFATPSLYANVYGNALYSILKLLAVVLLLLTATDVKHIEDYCWPLFCHQVILFLTLLQVVMQVRKQLKQVPVKAPAPKSDIIGYNDVPFLFNNAKV